LYAFEKWHRVIKKKVVILIYSVKSYCVLKMSKNKEEIWHILKFYYKKKKIATQTTKKICNVYGHDAISVRVVQSWFKRFHSRNLMSKIHQGTPRFDQPITGKVDEIMEKFEQDTH